MPAHQQTSNCWTRPCRVSLAGRLAGEMRCGLTASSTPKELTSQQVVRLHQLLHEVTAAVANWLDAADSKWGNSLRICTGVIARVTQYDSMWGGLYERMPAVLVSCGYSLFQATCDGCYIQLATIGAISMAACGIVVTAWCLPSESPLR